MTPEAIVSKLWNFCNVLRNDGMSYPPSQCYGRTGGYYVDQFTCLRKLP